MPNNHLFTLARASPVPPLPSLFHSDQPKATGFKEPTKCNFFGCNCRLRDAKGGFVRMPGTYAHNKVDGKWVLADSDTSHHLVFPDDRGTKVDVPEKATVYQTHT
jgi:hypothetical protein